MTLPQNDPANTGGAPIYQDNDFVRGSQMRANNQAIWENLEYLEDKKYFDGSITIEEVTSGDVQTTYITDGTTWSIGIDDSDSNKFKISKSADLGTTPYITIDITGKVGIGINTPDNLLHIYKGDSTGSSNSSALLTIENSVSVALQFLSPNTTSNVIFFGDPESASVGAITYSHSVNEMIFSTNEAVRLELLSDGKINIPSTGVLQHDDITILSTDRDIVNVGTIASHMGLISSATSGAWYTVVSGITNGMYMGFIRVGETGGYRSVFLVKTSTTAYVSVLASNGTNAIEINFASSIIRVSQSTGGAQPIYWNVNVRQ